MKPLSEFVNCCSLQDEKYRRERDDTSAWGIELLQTKSTCSVDDVAPTTIRRSGPLKTQKGASHISESFPLPRCEWLLIAGRENYSSAGPYLSGQSMGKAWHFWKFWGCGQMQRPATVDIAFVLRACAAWVWRP